MADFGAVRSREIQSNIITKRIPGLPETTGQG
jgi:hypothetical protein